MLWQGEPVPSVGAPCRHPLVLSCFYPADRFALYRYAVMTALAATQQNLSIAHPVGEAKNCTAAMQSSRGLRGGCRAAAGTELRSEEHTSELQSLMRTSYAAFGLKKK